MPVDATKGNWIYSLETKLIQRIGLLFCPPRLLTWQYQRGCRSLAENLAPRFRESQNVIEGRRDHPNNLNSNVDTAVTNEPKELSDDDDELDLEYADEVAEVIDRLISSLRNQYTVVRWSAAKG